jgi:hypothetical protein
MGARGSAPGPPAGADATDQERLTLAELIRRICRDAQARRGRRRPGCGVAAAGDCRCRVLNCADGGSVGRGAQR